MSNSLLVHLSRSGEVIVSDCDDIPHTDDLAPIMQIAISVLNAGYTGIAVDELPLSNGRFAQALEVNLATPEGQIFQLLSAISCADEKLPSPQEVLTALEAAYRMGAV